MTKTTVTICQESTIECTGKNKSERFVQLYQYIFKLQKAHFTYGQILGANKKAAMR